jgi:hypothetical protein
MKNIRRNSLSGIVEIASFGEKDVSLHFNEWWSGEGVDFTFDENKKVSLGLDEIHALFVAMVATEMVDLDSVINDAYDMRRESADREEHIRSLRSKYVGK